MSDVQVIEYFEGAPCGVNDCSHKLADMNNWAKHVKQAHKEEYNSNSTYYDKLIKEGKQND